MTSIFFSYSHKDEDLRNELEKHLSVLKRQGVIDTWHDRRLIAGAELDEGINQSLEKANIILLLVSSDFLASDYCYDNEMKYAMKKHDNGSATIIPVILRPCHWHEAPFGKLLAAPRDGKPVIKYHSQDEAFLEIIEAIKRVIYSYHYKQSNSNLNTDKKLEKFSSYEIEKFLTNSFEYIAKYFEEKLIALEKELKISKNFRKTVGRQQLFEVHIFEYEKPTLGCTVYRDMIYLSPINFYEHSYEKKHGTFSFANNRDDLCLKLTEALYNDAGFDCIGFEAAAEYIWKLFLKPLLNR